MLYHMWSLNVSVVGPQYLNDPVPQTEDHPMTSESLPPLFRVDSHATNYALFPAVFSKI